MADTKAQDGNPMGPYELDQSKLPIIEDSCEARPNGELQKRYEDYTLDAEYGSFRIKNKNQNPS